MNSEAIIFVPGIKGTKLVETNRVNHDTIWSGVQSNFESIEDLELSFRLGNSYFDQGIDNIIAAGEIEELAYSEFLHDLWTTKPIFVFAYDWRLSARENGARLARFVKYLIAKSKAAKLENPLQKEFKRFDFITHSLGNFVVRNYLAEHDKSFSHVNKIVFVAPPFKGGLDIASAVPRGEGWLDDVKEKIRKLIRTCPGALELLPTYAGVSRFEKGNAKHNLFNFDHWQKNVTNVDATGSKGILARKFKKALALAAKVSSSELCDLSTLSADKRSRILVIGRVGHKTSESITVDSDGRPKNRFDFDNVVSTESGDGRVSVASWCHYWSSVRTLLVEKSLSRRDYSHGFILKDERVQKMANRFLNDESLGSDAIHKSVTRVTGLTPPAEPSGVWSVTKTSRL